MRDQVIKALLLTSEIYGKEFTEAAARLLLSDLSEYDPTEILRALSKCRKELRHFPTVADIVQRIPGQAIDYRGQAIDIAGKIMKCVTYMGPYKVKESREEIGPVGWEVILRSGGWESICQMSDKDIGVRMPQWTQMAESMLRNGFTGQRGQIEQKPVITAALQKMPKEEK